MSASPLPQLRRHFVQDHGSPVVVPKAARCAGTRGEEARPHEEAKTECIPSWPLHEGGPLLWRRSPTDAGAPRSFWDYYGTTIVLNKFAAKLGGARFARPRGRCPLGHARDTPRARSSAPDVQVLSWGPLLPSEQTSSPAGTLAWRDAHRGAYHAPRHPAPSAAPTTPLPRATAPTHGAREAPLPTSPQICSGL